MKHIGGAMKKSGELLKVGIVILLAGTIAAGIHIYRNYENHRFDKYLASPEDAVEQCIKEIGSGRNTFPQDVSIYKYVKQKGKNAGAEPEGLVNLYNENLILDKTSSPDRYSEVVERTLWELRYCSFSESEKIIQSAEDEVYYRVKASNEKYNEELWIRLNQASNGLWYISQFTNRQPYSWDGNAPLSEKNKEFGETLIQNITDEEICRMFVHASAMKLNDNLGWDGFHSPSELGWKAYLDFMLGSFDETELATAYDETLKSYIFTENEIGSYVWQYLGDDEYENNALGSYGYPHTRVRRELEMYSFEAQGNGYLLLRTYFVTLTAGGGNGSVSISINNTQVTQRAFGETYNLFYFDDNQLFQDTVLEVLDSE